MPDTSDKTAPLLVEIGCEELPAGAVKGLAEAFALNLKQRLQQARLTEGEGDAPAWTPRRLLFRHPAVRLRQAESEQIVTGPPARVAYKPDGSLSPQAAGFAAKNGVGPEAVFKLTNDKGEYVAVRKKTGGAAADALLLELIPEALLAVPLPRSMRWEGELRFLRPIRWLLALHGAAVVPFRLGPLTAGAQSRGHRTLGKGEFSITDVTDYPERWKKNYVMPSPQERYEAIFAATRVPLQREDIELENTLVNLTEWPSVIVGEFESAYLKSLPADVLITVMRDHQKYLAVGDGNGNLAARFVAVLNQKDDLKGLIQHGNERVLRARFSDAQFFFNTDRKRTLRDRLPLLDQVTFQAKLGSYGAKAKRMKALAAWLAAQWPGCERAAAEQAAELAKCDLTTEMVKEFPELQGVMGGHYAQAEGLPAPVADAIADQYRWDTPPRSNEGAAVSLADKFDTIAGMFALGEIPSGSTDPFGLRRQGNGVIRTLIERKLALSLAQATEQALSGYGAHPDFKTDGKVKIAGFFEERLSFYLRDALGASVNQAVAVVVAGSDHPLDAAERLRAVQAAADLAAVAAVVKRARSIVRKEGGVEKWLAQPLDAAALREPAEQGLQAAVASLPDTQDYHAELVAIAGLAQPLERFFNEVRVNDENPAVRANRLALLAVTVARLNRVADFAELALG